MDATVSVVDIDPNFEPQTRARSNTWPCRPVEDLVEGQQVSPASDDPGVTDHTKDVLGIKQKTSSRRNAWGNLSYADLITKAIQSSPEQRLTLSQIYDWMVQNVPYFKDKGDNTSSAGWKNSIRHNLSLHSRFMRIQNEGTGKSSWWVINPDAKPGKAPRRRAGSMETKNLEKKRGRIRKRIEAIRANQENGSFSNEDFQDLHYNLNLSPEFRTRAGSNASSCGRLSPIQAAVEPDLHENQVPPMSPIPWDSESEPLDSNSQESFSIVDSLVGISLNLQETSNDQNDVEMLGESSVKQQLMSPSSYQFSSQNNYDNNNYGNLPAPPSYSDHLQQKGSPQPSVLDLDSMTSQARGYQNMGTKHLYAENLLTKQRQMQGSPSMGSPSSNALGINTQQLGSPSRSPQLSPSNYHHSPGGYHSPQTMKRSPQHLIAQQQLSQQQQQQQQQQQHIGGGTRSLLQQCLEAPDDSMLRQALTQQQLNPTYQQSRLSPLHQQQQQQQPPQQQYGHYNNVYSNAQLQGMGNTTMNMNSYTNSLNMVSQSGLMNNVPQMNTSQMGQIIQPQNSNVSLSEIETEPMLDLDYDVEQLLRQELALDANLDFNFDSSPQTQNVSTSDSQNLVR